MHSDRRLGTTWVEPEATGGDEDHANEKRNTDFRDQEQKPKAAVMLGSPRETDRGGAPIRCHNPALILDREQCPPTVGGHRSRSRKQNQRRPSKQVPQIDTFSFRAWPLRDRRQHRDRRTYPTQSSWNATGPVHRWDESVAAGGAAVCTMAEDT